MALSPRPEELQQPTLSPIMVVEVWYMIIDILCDAEEEEQDEGRSRTKCSSYLRDLISLSSSCGWLWNLLVPRIFAAVYLHNTVKSALSIKAFVNGEDYRSYWDLMAIVNLNATGNY